jgi:hypothetical protein
MYRKKEEPSEAIGRPKSREETPKEGYDMIKVMTHIALHNIYRDAQESIAV